MEEIGYKLKDRHLKIKDGVKLIGKEAFYNKKIQSVEIPESVVKIYAYAFGNNGLECVKIPSSVKVIGTGAFVSNCLTDVEIPNNVRIIQTKAFMNNNLKHIEIPSSVESIGEMAFSGNNLINLKISSGVKNIASAAFMNNNLTHIEIPSSISMIGTSAFRENQLQNVEIPSNINIVSSFSFYKNNLESIKISNGVKHISSYAFAGNYLTSVEIPDSVEFIGIGAFDKNVEIKYKGHIFSIDFISKFGLENIIKASKILDIAPNFNFDIIDRDVFNIIPTDNDSIKGYMNNYKIFDKLIEEYKLEYLWYTNDFGHDEYQDFYKMCYILGLFNTGGTKQEEVIKVIKDMCDIYTIDNIHQMFTDIELTKYKEKVAKIILSEYKHPKLKEIIAKLYNNYEDISKSIIKGRKEQIGLLNHENNVSPSTKIEQKLEHLKSLKKEIMIDDIIKYIKENVFIISEDCKELKEIATTLSSYLNQSEFEEIEKIYRKAKEEKEEIFKNITDKEQDKVHYYWSKGENPVNIILGYICDCCAKYRGAGEDIMIQSMINPSVKNLVIYDSMRHIIGKSTGYYNRDGKYIVFNNIEMKKSKNNNEKESLDAILRGIQDQVASMKERGYEVEDVRIGMLRNDLSDEIRRRDIEIEHDHLLENYHYKDYRGDASDYLRGQAIIKIR